MLYWHPFEQSIPVPKLLVPTGLDAAGRPTGVMFFGMLPRRFAGTCIPVGAGGGGPKGQAPLRLPTNLTSRLIQLIQTSPGTIVLHQKKQMGSPPPQPNPHPIDIRQT